MAKNEDKALVAAGENALLAGLIDEDELLHDLSESTNDFGASDVTIPFLRVLQQLSPQVTKGKSEYIEGATAGNFINTASKQVYDGEQGVLIIPCRFQNRYLEWRPRNKGGGLVRDFGTDAAAAMSRVAMQGEKGQNLTAEGNEIVRSFQYWALMSDGQGGADQIVLSLASTQAKKSKDWNYTIMTRKETIKGRPASMAKLPHFYTYKLTTVLESNDMGSWYGLRVTPHGRTLELPNGAEIFGAAKAFRELIDTGKVRTEVAHEGVDEDVQDSPF